jgi:Na+-transporting methylmalonyl-CoA/oxaloacetate decarboxylase gamma subunit
MSVTIDLKVLGWGLVILCLVILIIFCIVLVKNLMVTVKRTNQSLEDTEIITDIASERTKQLNSAVGDVADSVKGLAEVVKGNQSFVGAVSTLVKGIASLKNLIHRKKDSK